jgi:hypothetical protein
VTGIVASGKNLPVRVSFSPPHAEGLWWNLSVAAEVDTPLVVKLSALFGTPRQRRRFAFVLAPGLVCEHALAHGLPARWRRRTGVGDLLDKRVVLMQAWGDYCGVNGVSSAGAAT